VNVHTWLATALAGAACAAPAPALARAPLLIKPAPPAAASAGASYVPGVVLVRLRPRTTRVAGAAAADTVGGQVVRWIPQLQTEAITVGVGHELDAVLSLLRRSDVASVERDPVRTAAGHSSCGQSAGCVLPNDPLFPAQWSLYNHSSTNELSLGGSPGADIAAPAAWAYSRGSAGIRIAVVDSGIDDRHPDLRSKITEQATLASNGGDTADYIGHGTAVAGIAAAIPNNGIGIAGVGYNSSLMEVKIANNDRGGSAVADCAGLAGGIIYAADHGAQVINVSLGGAYCSAESQAVSYAWDRDALVVAAAGNDASNTPAYPAALTDVIAVGSTDSADRPADFSNYGPDWVDIAAPGTNIETTLPRNPNLSGKTDYGVVDGTSFSAPMVSGAAALIWPTVTDTNHDGYTSDEVLTRLLRYADHTPETGTHWRAGRLNVCRAVTADAAPCPPRRARVATMSNRTANSDLRRTLTAALGRAFAGGHAYKSNCRRVSQTHYRCAVLWAYRHDDYYGTVTVSNRTHGAPAPPHDSYVIHSVDRRCHLARHGAACGVKTYRRL
jgi:thermitase